MRRARRFSDSDMVIISFQFLAFAFDASRCERFCFCVVILFETMRVGRHRAAEVQSQCACTQKMHRIILIFHWSYETCSSCTMSQNARSHFSGTKFADRILFPVARDVEVENFLLPSFSSGQSGRSRSAGFSLVMPK